MRVVRGRCAHAARGERGRIEGERQRNIDLVIKYVISEDDAKQRIAGLKGERLRVEAELAALEEAAVPSRCIR